MRLSTLLLLAALSGLPSHVTAPAAHRAWLPLYVSDGAPWGGGDGYPDPR